MSATVVTAGCINLSADGRGVDDESGTVDEEECTDDESIDYLVSSSLNKNISIKCMAR